MSIGVVLRNRWTLTAAILLALLLLALLLGTQALHAAHAASAHVFADSVTPDVIIHNH